MPDETPSRNEFRDRLFDSCGLPWTSSLSWYWLYVTTVVTGLAFAFFLGIYLGLWLNSKGKGASVLLMYLVVAGVAVLLFFLPDRAQHTVEVFSGVIVILWFSATYVLRRKVIDYYSGLEGTPFKINPVWTGVFSVLYINGCLRAEFPVDETGKAAAGVLKLTIR